jgi:uncharacterized protein DUF4154
VSVFLLANMRGPRHLSPGEATRLSGLVGVALISFLVCLCGCAPAVRSQSTTTTEYDLKLAFLFNFAKFVEWPPDAFPNEKVPITLCVFGTDPFGRSLDEIVQGKMANNREFAIRRTMKPEDLHGCQIIFIIDAERGRLAEIFESLKHSSVLLVGESDGFAERGGCIQFYLEDNKVRFSINVDAVQRARLTVSSKLLALARIVHDEGHPKGG